MRLLITMAGLAMASGCSPISSVTCSNCQHSLTSSECAAFGATAGCSGTEPFTDTTCTPATTGCRFTLCAAKPTCGTNDGGM